MKEFATYYFGIALGTLPVVFLFYIISGKIDRQAVKEVLFLTVLWPLSYFLLIWFILESYTRKKDQKK